VAPSIAFAFGCLPQEFDPVALAQPEFAQLLRFQGSTTDERSLPMKWLSALILTALVATGCRSSQPATNPFMRTTVPPPGTGQAVVVQGEPYMPPVAGAPSMPAPVMPAAPAPTFTPAPPSTTFVPATPPPAAVSPPIMAPPPVMAPPAAPMVAPPKDKYSPPGGSFQYNQSSLGAGQRAATLASYSAPAAGRPPGSARLREAIASHAASASTTPAPAAAPLEEAKPVRAPTPKPASGKSGSAIRIAGGSKQPSSTLAQDVSAATKAATEEAPAVDAESARVIDEVNRQQRQAAGKSAFKEVGRSAATPMSVPSVPSPPRGSSQLAIVTPDTVSDTTESFAGSR